MDVSSYLFYLAKASTILSVDNLPIKEVALILIGKPDKSINIIDLIYIVL